MSEGGSDETYIPAKSAVKKLVPATNPVRPVRSTRKDYREVEVVLSDSEEIQGEGSVGDTQLVDRKVKAESLVGEIDPSYLDSEQSWSPQTLVTQSKRFTKELTRLSSTKSELEMARDQEQSNITALMQMMIEMRTQDN